MSDATYRCEPRLSGLGGRRIRTDCVVRGPRHGVTDAWSIEPFDLEYVESSYFDDESRFPADSIALESALVMRNVLATWHRAPSIDLKRLVPAVSVDSTAA